MLQRRVTVLALLVGYACHAKAELLRGKPAVNGTVADQLAKAPHSAPGRSPKLLNASQLVVPHQLMDVSLGPFDTSSLACSACFKSFTKKGEPPAGPVAPLCLCYSMPGDKGHDMFCSTMKTAVGHVRTKKGCRCVEKDFEAMGATTCKAIE
mmetsp:Transcript_61777/g.119022  ORF Transcript_61777/g.119022 Transcript_61777/m.119022 type:complete len:152 (+) Transcript_61777:74-529(+)